MPRVLACVGCKEGYLAHGTPPLVPPSPRPGPRPGPFHIAVQNNWFETLLLVFEMYPEKRN